MPLNFTIRVKNSMKCAPTTHTSPRSVGTWEWSSNVCQRSRRLRALRVFKTIYCWKHKHYAVRLGHTVCAPCPRIELWGAEEEISTSHLPAAINGNKGLHRPSWYRGIRCPLHRCRSPGDAHGQSDGSPLRQHARLPHPLQRDLALDNHPHPNRLTLHDGSH